MNGADYVTRELIAKGVSLPVATPRPIPKYTPAQEAYYASMRKSPEEIRAKRSAYSKMRWREKRKALGLDKKPKKPTKELTILELQKQGRTLREIAAIKGIEFEEVKRVIMESLK